MIDFDKIGNRIYEQRKYFRKLSQERMAEELGMYQADISNIEKAKKGSGITDLSKLDMIAEYLEIPLETLLFGREDKTMLKYHGSKMKLRKSRKKLTKGHKNALIQLTGIKEDQIAPLTFECGPYMIYSTIEEQSIWGDNTSVENGRIINPEFVLPKLHTYVFLGTEVIGVMDTALTTLMQHVYQPHLHHLQNLIPGRILDVTDVWRTLNPYWALWHFTDDGPEKDNYYDRMFRRMDELRESGENRPILYVESVYVREDCRQNGIFRMYIDFLKLFCGECIIWLNMEPTSGSELEREAGYLPNYTISDLGQISLNASIAEKLGFTVDPDAWHINATVLGEDGEEKNEVVLVRKCAYFLPKRIRELLKNDGDLVAVGRAKQKLVQKDEPIGDGADIRDGDINGYWVSEWTSTVEKGPDAGKKISVFAAVNIRDRKKYTLGVSEMSIFQRGLDDTPLLEEYHSLEDAEVSAQFDLMKGFLSMATANAMLKYLSDNINVVKETDGTIRAELDFSGDDGKNVFIYGESSSDGQLYAVSDSSILEALENTDDDEIPTLEEYYDYDSTQGSAYAQLFELVHNKLEKA